MSCEPDEDSDDKACVNCGKHGSDTVKLKDCTACRIVSITAAWTVKRPTASSTREHVNSVQLYSQGHERPEGDFCPICTLPIPSPMGEHSTFNCCCMKNICDGCDFAVKKKGMFDCPFCRSPRPDNDAAMLALVQAASPCITVLLGGGKGAAWYLANRLVWLFHSRSTLLPGKREWEEPW